MKKEHPTIVQLIQKAYREGWAIGEFNVGVFEVAQWIAEAAQEIPTPLLIGVSPRTVEFLGLSYLEAFIKVVKDLSTVPVYFHLDHGEDFAIVEACIRANFDSVMIDASMYPFAENVARTRAVVELAHRHGVSVEAQVGQPLQSEENHTTTLEVLTDPKLAAQFVEETKIDYLAVSVGETPGKLVGQTHLNLNLLQDIAQATMVPLVLHGGTSINEENLREAIRLGVAKVNIDTAIRKAVTTVMTEHYRHDPPPTDIRIPFKALRQAVRTVVAQKTQILGSVGKAG